MSERPSVMMAMITLGGMVWYVIMYFFCIFYTGRQNETFIFWMIVMHPEKSAPKMSSGEKAAAKKEQAKINKAKANPELAAMNKEKADAKRLRRKESGSTKSFK
jgi:hypothetical protein